LKGSTEDLSLSRVRDLQEEPPLTDSQIENLDKLLVFLRGPKTITPAKRLEITQIIVELRAWAGTVHKLSTDRSQSLQELFSTTHELQQTSKLAKDQAVTLKETSEQRDKFKRDTVALESRMPLEYTLEDAWKEHDMRCTHVIEKQAGGRRPIYACLEHLGKSTI